MLIAVFIFFVMLISNTCSSVDFRGKLWVCPFCFQRNPFPPNYADISETNLPAELIPKYTTMEYVISRGQPLPPPVFLFVVDTCLVDEELQELKNSLLKSLTMIPEQSLIGLITFGKTASCAKLGALLINVSRDHPLRSNFSNLLSKTCPSRMCSQAPRMSLESRFKIC